LFAFMRKCGSVDTVSYNTILNSYCKRRIDRFDRVVSLLDLMKTDAVDADEITYNTIINAAVQNGNVRLAWDCVDLMRCQNMKVDRYACSILIKSVKQSSHHDDRARALDLIDNIDICQDLVLFSTVVDACSRLRDITRLRAALSRFQQSDLLPNLHAYGSLIKAYGRCGDVENAWLLWNSMEERHLEPSNYVYGCMLDTLVANGHLASAISLLQSMLGTKIPNTVHYSIVIKGCADQRSVGKAFELYEDMKMRGVKSNAVTYNSLINACTSVGDMGLAFEILTEMTRQSGCVPDLITYSTMIKGFCANGDIIKAFEVFNLLDASDSLRCDTVVYNTLLEGTAKRLNVEMTETIFNKMLFDGVSPSAFTLSIMIKLHGRVGNLQRALDLASTLPKLYRFSFDSYVYTSLIAACIVNNRLDLAVFFFEEMLMNGCRISGRMFGTIINGCFNAGDIVQSLRYFERAVGLNLIVESSVINRIASMMPNVSDDLLIDVGGRQHIQNLICRVSYLRG